MTDTPLIAIHAFVPTFMRDEERTAALCERVIHASKCSIESISNDAAGRRVLTIRPSTAGDTLVKITRQLREEFPFAIFRQQVSAIDGTEELLFVSPSRREAWRDAWTANAARRAPTAMLHMAIVFGAIAIGVVIQECGGVYTNNIIRHHVHSLVQNSTGTALNLLNHTTRAFSQLFAPPAPPH